MSAEPTETPRRGGADWEWTGSNGIDRRRVILGTLIILAVARCMMLPPRVESLTPSWSPPEMSSATLLRQTYQPNALVVVDVGADGEPGAAGVDDANNGVIDDADETGATGTDDTFAIEPAGGNSLPTTARVIGNGGWVTIGRAEIRGISRSPETAWQRTADPDRRQIVVANGWERMLP